jgi:predicted component of type VI protein secretion system
MDSDPFIVVKAGSAVFREGDAGTAMYIIESGSVDIVRAQSGKEPLATLEAGDFFGEMAVLEDQPRFASALAQTDCRLLQIDRAQFGDVLRENVEIAIRIMRKLVGRLRRSDQRASEAHAALDEFKRRISNRSAAAAPAAAPEPAPAPAPPPRPAPAPPPPAPVAAPVARALQFRHIASGQCFPLAGSAELLVGRPDPVTGINPEVNLGPFDQNRSLSRRHAKILVEGDQVSVREEVGTANGTYVNDTRLQTGAPARLAAGDKVRFGSVEVVVEAV